jgi:hypothetical protein
MPVFLRLAGSPPAPGGSDPAVRSSKRGGGRMHHPAFGLKQQA